MALDAHSGLVLGIETSCDETAAAVVRGGRHVLSNAIASQVAVHAPYGGVVPEIASREHLRQIVPVVRQALSDADAQLDQVCAIAVTEGPGLAGALMVGIAYAKALAFSADKPLIAVNHLEGHIHSALITAQAAGPVQMLALALVVSGGHTHLYLVEDSAAGSIRNVGRTVDDAAGEAFDKVGKLLGLGYPGGPWVSALAEHGNPRAVPFSFAQVKSKHGKARQPDAPLLFSFSGIKTAVARYMELHGMHAAAARRAALLAERKEMSAADLLPFCEPQALDLLASFQHAVVEDLLRKCLRAAQLYGARTLLVSGGVAASLQLRKRFTSQALADGLNIAFPAAGLSTDNAAMIASAAWPKFLRRQFAPAELSAQPSLRL